MRCQFESLTCFCKVVGVFMVPLIVLTVQQILMKVSGFSCLRSVSLPDSSVFMFPMIVEKLASIEDIVVYFRGCFHDYNNGLTGSS